MRLPGNTWVEAWQRAEPVPVSRQKPLFDATQEAEKVLHRLSALSPAALVLQVLPSVLGSVLDSMRQHLFGEPLAGTASRCVLGEVVNSLECLPLLSADVAGLSSARSVYEGLCALLNRVHAPSIGDLATLQESARLVEQGEGLVAAAHSVWQKLVRGLEMKGVPVTTERREELR